MHLLPLVILLLGLPAACRGLPLLYLAGALAGAAVLPWAVRTGRRMLVASARRELPELVGSSALELPDGLDHLEPCLAELAEATRTLRCDLEDVVRDANAWQDTTRFSLRDRLLGTWFLPEVDGPTYVTRELWEWQRTVDRLSPQARAQLRDLGLATTEVSAELSSDGDFYARLRRCLRHLELFDRTLRIQSADPFRGTPPRPVRRPSADYDGGECTKAHGEPDLDAAFRDHEPRLRRTLASLGVPEQELDDAVQEVFTVAHRRRADFDGRARFEHWLFGIARGVAANARRRMARDPTPLLTEPCGPAHSPADVLLWQEQLELASAAIDGLRPEQRDVFVRVDLQGDRITDLARSEGTKRSTLYSRLRLARRSVRRTLANETD